MADAALSAGQLAYMMSHASDNRVPDIIVCASIFGVVSTIFLSMRLISRREAYGRLRLDASDWLILVSWIFFLAYDVGFAVTTAYGSGRHIIFANNLRMLQIFSIFSEATYALSMAFLKMSILSLYGSIFPSRRFHYCLWAVAVFTVLWTVSSVVGAIAQCLPIAYGWDKTIQGGICWGYGILALTVCATNVLSDFIILGLPVPLVLRLQVTSQKKRFIIITFAIGSSACIISIIRLPFLLQVGTIDGSWTAVPSGYVSCLELTLGIFAVSVPTYRALYKRIFQSTGSAWAGAPGSPHHSWKNLLKMTRWASKPESVSSGSHRHSNELDSNGKYQHTTTVYTGAQLAAPTQGINVTDDVEMVRYANRNGSWAQIRDDEQTRRTTAAII